MAKTERVGVVGFSGYSGAELVKILRRHPRAEPVLLEHRSQSASDSPFGLNGVPRLAWSRKNLKEGKLSLVFLATPHEVSLDLVPMALDAGLKVIDLSGAFRLRTVENYRRWYKMEHTRPDLLAEAVYGLPEYRTRVVTRPPPISPCGRSSSRASSTAKPGWSATRSPE